MARLTRHQLKQDDLSARLATGMDFFLANKKMISLVSSIVAGVLAIGLGSYFFIRGAQANAGTAFAKALDTYHAPVMNDSRSIPNLETYKTIGEKNEKALEKFSAVAKDYSHYKTGRLARYYGAICMRELGKYPDAEKEFQTVAQSGDKQLAPLAKLGLATVYEVTNRPSDAEKVYKDLEDHPTETVPKATALMARADLYRRTNPAEATKLYEQIKKDFAGTAAAEHASQMLTETPR